ncbi:MAG: hypothetical protein ACON4Z_00575 [Planctomycetota bacterium]
MSISRILLGAAAITVVAALALRARGDRTAAAAPDAAAATVPTPPAAAAGHYVLVVEGDRDGLDVTFARAKRTPWAGAPKGLASSWRLAVLAADGSALADVPLDVRRFATDAASKGAPVTVRGCVVVDSRIGMLVSVPRFAGAARYRFTRSDERGVVTNLGEVPASRVRELAEELR